MSLHVECGLARISGGVLDPVERGGSLQWSETLAAAATTANAAPAAPSGDVAVVFTLTAEVNMWVAIGTAPNAGDTSLRRRMRAGQTRSFLAPVGVKVAWVVG